MVGRNTRRRTQAKTECDRILGDRTFLLDDFNVHSPQWNFTVEKEGIQRD